MTTQKIIYLLIGLILGFVVGFALANNINRGEQEALRAEVTRLRAGGAGAEGAGDAAGQSKPASRGDQSIPTLSDEQLRNAVAKADASPNDAALQRVSGQGLYLYAMQTGKAQLLPDAARILKRAHDANPKDYQTLVMLGNALFDLAQNGEQARMSEARADFQRALEMKPEDADVHTALGMTYYYDRPPAPARAVQEFRRALTIDARNEMALQNLAAALIEAGDFAEAQKRIDELQSVNAQNAALPNLRAQLEQKKNAAREGK